MDVGGVVQYFFLDFVWRGFLCVGWWWLVMMVGDFGASEKKSNINNRQREKKQGESIMRELFHQKSERNRMSKQIS